MLQPKYQYTFTNAKDLQNYDYHASKVKLIDCDGRSGVNLGGIRDALVLPNHTANEDKGAVSFWMMSMEDLYPAAHHDNHGESNPHFWGEIKGSGTFFLDIAVFGAIIADYAKG